MRHTYVCKRNITHTRAHTHTHTHTCTHAHTTDRAKLTLQVQTFHRLMSTQCQLLPLNHYTTRLRCIQQHRLRRPIISFPSPSSPRPSTSSPLSLPLLTSAPPTPHPCPPPHLCPSHSSPLSLPPHLCPSPPHLCCRCCFRTNSFSNDAMSACKLLR